MWPVAAALDSKGPACAPIPGREVELARAGLKLPAKACELLGKCGSVSGRCRAKRLGEQRTDTNQCLWAVFSIYRPGSMLHACHPVPQGRCD